MTGLPLMNFPAFHAAAETLRGLGHDVVNPADAGSGGDWSYEEYLRRDLLDLLSCNAICLLPGWERSKGATVEEHMARALGFVFVELPADESAA
jgi:hypothetical protein